MKRLSRLQTVQSVQISYRTSLGKGITYDVPKCLITLYIHAIHKDKLKYIENTLFSCVILVYVTPYSKQQKPISMLTTHIITSIRIIQIYSPY